MTDKIPSDLIPKPSFYKVKEPQNEYSKKEQNIDFSAHHITFPRIYVGKIVNSYNSTINAFWFAVKKGYLREEKICMIKCKILFLMLLNLKETIYYILKKM